MNKFFKVLIAILGAINMVVAIFIPIALALVIVKIYPDLGSFNQKVVLIIGSLSSIYKGINVAFLKD